MRWSLVRGHWGRYSWDLQCSQGEYKGLLQNRVRLVPPSPSGFLSHHVISSFGTHPLCDTMPHEAFNRRELMSAPCFEPPELF
jgi:hypothetical protein